ncbi:Exocyst complex component 4 [Arachnomyces sp. PD_36]|nr:Exocyst complex component 4 [Arachnomyces sp. PD_36]
MLQHYPKFTTYDISIPNTVFPDHDPNALRNRETCNEMNGRNGYADGYPDPGRSNRYDGGYGGLDNNNNNNTNNGSPSGSMSGARDRRAGGYGGFYGSPQPSSSSLDVGEPQQPQGQGRPSTSSSSRPRILDVVDAARRRPGGGGGVEDGGYGGGSSRSVERARGDGNMNGNGEAGRGMGGQRVTDILQTIEREWDFMASDDCIPVQVGLQLMDSSTLGHANREPEFLETNKQIQRALKSIVNEHHQGFNSSIGTYHKIQSSIQTSQSRVRLLKSSLTDTRSGLLTTKPELKGLATSSQNYDDILQLFSQIENILSLPEKLEARISEKRFLAAVEILQDGLRLVNRSDLEHNGGLSDIRTYFSNQEMSLTDILIEELHDHLYLKSPYCQDRWKPPVSTDEKGTNTQSTGANGAVTWEKPIYRFLSKLETSTPLVEDASRNPEADTFYYIHLIIEALNKMGHLDVAVDRIEQRLPVELFYVVDKTNAEVDTRYPPHTRNQGHRDDGKPHLPNETDNERGLVLNEFLWALYAKFEAIAESHRVVHDVVSGIVEREGIRKSGSLTSGFKELWKLYQSEMRSLLHDYLATDGDSSFRSGLGSSEVSYALSNQRDKTRRLFKLSEVDQTSAEMKSEQDDLEEILRASVPGLVTKSLQKTTTGDDARPGQGNSGTGHKLLIEPSVFNMGLLLPPALSFIQRLKDIVPLNSDIAMSTLTSFLDDFLVNVFHPQLEEAVTDFCTLNLISLDAFTEESQWANLSPRPIFKGTIAFMDLVKAFSKMLDSIPHDQIFTQLIINQIVTYYDKCCGWYKALVTRMSPNAAGGIRLKAAASYAESGEIRDVTNELWKATDSDRQGLINKQTEILVKSTNETPLEPFDMVSDPKTVIALSLLYNSMQWLVNHLIRLRHITTHQIDSSRPESSHSHNRRWTLISAQPNHDNVNQPIYLPMTQESVVAFDNTIQALRDLATTALLTLQLDTRCGAIHMITRTMAGPDATIPPARRPSMPTTPVPSTTTNFPHILPHEPTAASTTILDLNNDLISFDTNTSAYLGRPERHFITSGLAHLIDEAFISSTRLIGAMNNNGAQRLQLDLLVLQQNLKNIIITESPTSTSRDTTKPSHHREELIALPRSAKFLDWFLAGPTKTLEFAQKDKEYARQQKNAPNNNNNNNDVGELFTYEELQILVELCFSDLLKGPRGAESREEFMAAKRGIGEAMLKLGEIMWD